MKFSKGCYGAHSVALLVIVFAATSCGESSAGGGKTGKSTAAAKVAIVHPVVKGMQRNLSAVGELEAEHIVTVSAQVPGIVSSIPFEEGQEVKSGDVIVKIDPIEYELRHRQAKAEFDKSDAVFALAKATLERWEGLHTKKLITDQEFQNYQTDFIKARADKQRAQAALAEAAKQLADTAVTAPQSAPRFEIHERFVSVGEYVTAGKPLAKLVYRGRLKLVFHLSETEAMYVRTKMPVEFTTPACPGRSFSAEVYYVGPIADERSRAVTVKAMVENPEKLLRSGYTTTVEIVGERKDSAVVIPSRAVKFDKNGYYVLLVEDGKAVRRVIKMGITTETETEVAEGVSPDSVVILKSGPMVKDGSPVEPITQRHD